MWGGGVVVGGVVKVKNLLYKTGVGAPIWGEGG